MTSDAKLSPQPNLIGMAELVRGFEAGRDMEPVWNGLVARLDADPRDAAALMDIATFLMIRKLGAKGAGAQREALAIARRFHRTYGKGGGLRVAAFVTAGDLMANTPLDFLLTGSDFELDLIYVDGETADLAHVPPHDVAVVAVGESPENQEVLARLGSLLADWPVPVFNGPPSRIAGLTRDGVCGHFETDPNILAPSAMRVPRAALEAMARGEPEGAQAGRFPLIIRPIASHAGEGLERVRGHDELVLYLACQKESEFFVSPFIDYSGPDGLFRKQRIAFIDGVAYAAHGATSEHWMVHYINAGMRKHAARRAEEADFMGTFDTAYAARHKVAFAALVAQLGLDYFAIDCAEMADGRLLLFEADIAMVLHDADSPDLFPYKAEPMQRLFAAFQQALLKRAATGRRDAAA
ncbi:tetratricopeptide repeat-containing protein [Xanthobacteraceae bacterium A53D]